MERADVPENVRHEIVKLQSNDELDPADNNLPLLEFSLRRALNFVYLHSVFYKLTLAKTQN